jgi:hypothetical protein
MHGQNEGDAGACVAIPGSVLDTQAYHATYTHSVVYYELPDFEYWILFENSGRHAIVRYSKVTGVRENIIQSTLLPFNDANRDKITMTVLYGFLIVAGTGGEALGIEIEKWIGKTLIGESLRNLDEITLARRPPLFPVFVGVGLSPTDKPLSENKPGVQFCITYTFSDGRQSTASPPSLPVYQRPNEYITYVLNDPYPVVIDARDLVFIQLAGGIESVNWYFRKDFGLWQRFLITDYLSTRFRVDGITPVSWDRVYFGNEEDLSGIADDNAALLQPSDNVPLTPYLPLPVENRLVFADIGADYNLPKARLTVTKTPILSSTSPKVLKVFRSDSKYKVSVILSDRYGRRTLALPATSFNTTDVIWRKGRYPVTGELDGAFGESGPFFFDIETSSGSKPYEDYRLNVTFEDDLPSWVSHIRVVQSRAIGKGNFVQVAARFFWSYKVRNKSYPDPLSWINAYDASLEMTEACFVVSNNAPIVASPGQYVRMRGGLFNGNSWTNNQTKQWPFVKFKVTRIDGQFLYVEYDRNKVDLATLAILTYFSITGGSPIFIIDVCNADSSDGANEALLYETEIVSDAFSTRRSYDFNLVGDHFLARNSSYNEKLIGFTRNINYSSPGVTDDSDNDYYSIIIHPDVRVIWDMESEVPYRQGGIYLGGNSFAYKESLRKSSVTRKRTMVASDVTLEDTDLVGISRFSNNVTIQLPSELGDIIAINTIQISQREASRIAVNQRYGAVMIYLGRVPILTTAGGLEARSTDFFSQLNVINGACYCLDRRHVTTDKRGRIWVLDEENKDVWRWANDGLNSLGPPRRCINFLSKYLVGCYYALWVPFLHEAWFFTEKGIVMLSDRAGSEPKFFGITKNVLPNQPFAKPRCVWSNERGHVFVSFDNKMYVFYPKVDTPTNDLLGIEMERSVTMEYREPYMNYKEPKGFTVIGKDIQNATVVSVLDIDGPQEESPMNTQGQKSGKYNFTFRPNIKALAGIKIRIGTKSPLARIYATIFNVNANTE